MVAASLPSPKTLQVHTWQSCEIQPDPQPPVLPSNVQIGQMQVFSIAMVYTITFSASFASSVWWLSDADAGLQYHFADHPTAITAGQVVVCELDPWWLTRLRMIKYEWNDVLLYPDHLSHDHSISFFFPLKTLNYLLPHCLEHSPFHHYSLHLLPHCWEIVEVSPLSCHNCFCISVVWLVHNCFSTVLQLFSTTRSQFILPRQRQIFFHCSGARRVCARWEQQKAVMGQLLPINTIFLCCQGFSIWCERGIQHLDKIYDHEILCINIVALITTSATLWCLKVAQTNG